jgi:hypothetical protein
MKIDSSATRIKGAVHRDGSGQKSGNYHLKGLHYKSEMREDFLLIPPNPYPVRALQRFYSCWQLRLYMPTHALFTSNNYWQWR